VNLYNILFLKTDLWSDKKERSKIPTEYQQNETRMLNLALSSVSVLEMYEIRGYLNR